ncbi:MAG: hypothetical protein B6D61_01555 [Bacteroidetes bacterium 4484_249]|nr:MAG: hypothetical protein B6D61_01555 [Bacteroidetes bacterium 4484_249]
MKQSVFKTLGGLVFITGAFLAFSSFTNYQSFYQEKSASGNQFVIPDDVNEILTNKCFDCHNVNAEGEKEKKKLLIDKLPELSKAKLIAKLDAIAETTQEGEMPPEDFLKDYPEYKLTKEESQLLIDWANSTADELLK